MKKFASLFLIAAMMLSVTACGNSAGTASAGSVETARTPSSQSTVAESEETQTAATGDETNNDGTKILIAYFSRADENYGVGVIEKGNTEIVAEMIADETGGALFHMERDTPYPAEYDACTDEAKAEQNSKARPALKEDIDISAYDVIFLGHPNWWGDMPMPVYTFLEAHDFSGKTVVPFCTHAGSGLSSTKSSIESVTGAEVLDGLAIAGTTAQNDRDEALRSVQGWLENVTLPE